MTHPAIKSITYHPPKFKVEVNTVSCAPDAWSSNGIEHDTLEDAKDAAADLFFRWTAIKHYRVVESILGATGQVVYESEGVIT